MNKRFLVKFISDSDVMDEDRRARRIEGVGARLLLMGAKINTNEKRFENLSKRQTPEKR